MDAGLDLLSLTQRIPLSLIDPPRCNPREAFDEADLRELAGNIADVGLLQPVVVRPAGERFELVAGERRFRAVQLNRGETIAATVRELSDREAAEIRLSENLERESLSPLEESTALQMLLALGHDFGSLATLVHREAAQVEARARLTELPAFWKEWLEADRADSRRGLAAEMLVEFIDVPPVLDAMQSVTELWPMPLSAWRRKLTDLVLLHSRDAEPASPVGPAFRLTKPLAKRLDIRDVRVGREVQPRAFNVALFDQLNDGIRSAAEPLPRGAKASGNGRPSSNGRDSGRAPEATDTPAELAAEAPAEPDDGFLDEPAADDFPARLQAWFAHHLKFVLSERLDALDLAELLHLAETLGIDPEAEFRPTRSFLQLHSGRQLAALAAEWGVPLAECRTRAEAVSALLNCRTATFPQALCELTSGAAR